MRRRAIALAIVVAVILGIGGIPYLVSLSSCQGQSGYLGRIDGVQYQYALVDRTHFDSLHVLVYPATYGDCGTRVRFADLDILLDGRPVEFGSAKVMMLTDDGTFVPLGWDDEWFVKSEHFSSEIGGLFGRVPHFKKYEVEGLDANPDISHTGPAAGIERG